MKHLVTSIIAGLAISLPAAAQNPAEREQDRWKLSDIYANQSAFDTDMCTLLGMALGGWMSGQVFDLTGSYRAAFINGIGWNLLNLSIAYFLLRRTMGPGRREYSAAA